MDVQFPQYSVRRFAVCFVLSIYRKSTDSSAWEKWLVFDARLLKKPLLTWVGICHAAGNCTDGKIAIQALVNTMGVSVAAAFCSG